MLERGFKSWCERLAGGIRRELAIAPHAPLPPADLADYLDITLLTPADIPGLSADVRRQLLEVDPWGWSATTHSVGGCTQVIYNPRHSPGRQASNIVHELSHVLLEHKPSMIVLSLDGSIAMRTFDGQQEGEAAWLSGCVLLPRVALLAMRRQRKSTAEIAEEFGVSEPLVTYRIRMTGVDFQFRRRSRAAS